MLRTELLLACCAMLALSCLAPEPGSASADEGEIMRPMQNAETEESPHIVTPRGEIIHLEVARTDAQRARGLMFRESVPENHGMLFVFRESERHGFWMKNTFIPLDMLWITADGTISEIMRAVPPCTSDPCPSYAPDAAGLYTLELAAGEADRLGLREGDRLDLRNIETPPGG